MNQVPAFFERIGLPADTAVTPTADFLGCVQEACVLTIPYENLDILAGRPISLDADAIYDKIVSRHRGGYCFEVNALLHHMLAAMGLKAESRLARFLRGETAIPFGRHRIVIVKLEERQWLLDIGVGQIAPRRPLALMEGLVQEQNGEAYRFERDPALGWVLWDRHNGDWRRYISFTDFPAFEVDFTVPSFWCEAHPDSPFNKAPMLAIKTPDGRKTVDGRTFKRFIGDRLASMEEGMSDARLLAVLEKEFGISAL